MSPSPLTRVLIIGASYAGLATATNLLDLSEGRPQRFSPADPAPPTAFPISITIVDERDGYYHVIGSPLALASSTFAGRSWTCFKDVPGMQHPAIKFVRGSATAVDVERKVAKIAVRGAEGDDGEGVEVGYDYLVAASGLRRVAPVVPASLTREDYLLEVGRHIDRVQRAADKEGVVVIGGGAVGIEMAAELKLVYPSLKVTLVHSRDRLLSSEPLPDDFKDETLKLLREIGVEVVIGRRVNDISEPNVTNGTIQLTLSDDSQLAASFVINAISRSTATSSYLPESVLTDEGYVKIEPTLHFLPGTSSNGRDLSGDATNEVSPDTAVKYSPYHLAAGDMTHWTGIRRCGAAMHMGSFAAHNIHAHILSSLSASSAQTSRSPQPQYKSLAVHPPMIGLALGSTGIAYSPTEGIKRGPDILAAMFQDDIGFSICWNYMRLGEAPPTPTVHAGPADLVDSSQELEKATRELSLEEWIAEAKAIPVHESRSKWGPSSPSVSTSSGSLPEPETPFDAVGNADVTNFEVLDGGEVVDLAVEAGGEVVQVPKTKVSPIRVVQAETV